jgi:prepilin-type N-terminal cleavage/methylation domain-containing protein
VKTPKTNSQKTNTMKNVKVTKSLKAGFSLVEMLVVIAIIGIIAAIAIPNIGTVNAAAKEATNQRNAQSVASVLNAAIAAGVDTTGWTTTGVGLVDTAEAGVSPTDGPFEGKTFSSGEIEDSEEAGAAAYLTWDGTNQQVLYTKPD